MDDTQLVLTFDVGTQSARCLLVRPDGSFADFHQIKYDEPYYSRNPGWAEQRPDFYYDRICEAGKVVCERNKDKLQNILAVTITTIRDTVLCLDENNEPLRDIILWLDKRQADFDDPFPLWKKWIFRLRTYYMLQSGISLLWLRGESRLLFRVTVHFKAKSTGNI